ncbi:MAG: CerR family C-terminal domain-containing protein [Candidatus Acidiferrales bacterium]
MGRGRKRTEHPETARRILAAAENQFAAQGLAGARTDEIAAAAHANKAMLYYYFGNKRRLHRAVLENLFGHLRGLFESLAVSKEPPRKKLEIFMNGYFNFLATHPNYPRLVQREAMQSSREFEWIFREFLRPFANTLQKIIEAGVEAEEFRPIDSRHAVFSLIGMTNFYFVAAHRFGHLFGKDMLAPRAIAERKRAQLDFIMHGLMPSESRSR